MAVSLFSYKSMISARLSKLEFTGLSGCDGGWKNQEGMRNAREKRGKSWKLHRRNRWRRRILVVIIETGK